MLSSATVLLTFWYGNVGEFAEKVQGDYEKGVVQLFEVCFNQLINQSIDSSESHQAQVVANQRRYTNHWESSSVLLNSVQVTDDARADWVGR